MLWNNLKREEYYFLTTLSYILNGIHGNKDGQKIYI